MIVVNGPTRLDPSCPKIWPVYVSLYDPVAPTRAPVPPVTVTTLVPCVAPDLFTPVPVTLPNSSSPFLAMTVSVPVMLYGITGGAPSGVNSSFPNATNAPRCDRCPVEENVRGDGLVEVSTDATPFDLPFSRKLVPEAAAWLNAGQISPAPRIKPETKIRLATNMPYSLSRFSLIQLTRRTATT